MAARRVPPTRTTVMSQAAMHEFEALDLTHADVVLHLRRLEALIARLGETDADDQARELAATVRDFFDDTARRHHADEERFVFPPLLASDDADSTRFSACSRITVGSRRTGTSSNRSLTHWHAASARSTRR